MWVVNVVLLVFGKFDSIIVELVGCVLWGWCV